MFEVKRNTLNKTIQNLYLDKSPKQISEIWPALWNNEDFKQVKEGHIYNAFTVLDSQSEYFCITTKWEDYPHYGPCYDIDKDQAFAGYTYYNHDDQVLLSADEPIIFYALHKQRDTLQLSQFRFSSHILRDIEPITQSSPWRNLCDSGNGMEIYSTSAACKYRPYDMPVLKGFLKGDMFYLFGTKEVTIFAVDTYRIPEKKFPVIKISYGAFFLCDKGNIPDTTDKCIQYLSSSGIRLFFLSFF